jgi:uncharacterized protein
MTVWALSDPHLSFGTQGKSMEVFGSVWENYQQKIETHWRECITDKDLVLIPGDISWAMTIDQALVDLKWIDALPGKKVILKGNHDYWWPSNAKLSAILPPSIAFINNNTYLWNDVAIGGVRLWDSTEYNFNAYITFKENTREKKTTPNPEHDKKIFDKDLQRLRRSLEMLDSNAKYRVALTHYPPIGADLQPSIVSRLLEEFKITHCVFGHLHSVTRGTLPFGKKNGVQYIFTSGDYIDFKPVEVISRN